MRLNRKQFTFDALMLNGINVEDIDACPALILTHVHGVVLHAKAGQLPIPLPGQLTGRIS